MSNTVGVKIIDWLRNNGVLVPMSRAREEHFSREIDRLLDFPDTRRKFVSSAENAHVVGITAPEGE